MEIIPNITAFKTTHNCEETQTSWRRTWVDFKYSKHTWDLSAVHHTEETLHPVLLNFISSTHVNSFPTLTLHMTVSGSLLVLSGLLFLGLLSLSATLIKQYLSFLYLMVILQGLNVTLYNSVTNGLFLIFHNGQSYLLYSLTHMHGLQYLTVSCIIVIWDGNLKGKM